jgi:hypothetical protein
VPSAWGSAHRAPITCPRFAEFATLPTRAPDPYMTMKDGFVRCGLAPDSRRPELGIHLDAQLQDPLL